MTQATIRALLRWVNLFLSAPLTALVPIVMMMFGLAQTTIIMTVVLFAFAFALNEVPAWWERKVQYYAASPLD